MRKAEGYGQISQAVSSIRALHRGFTTNFFLSQERVDALVLEGAMFIEQSAECLLLLQRDGDFYRLYYLAAGMSGLESGLRGFLTGEGREMRLVTDIVGTRVSNEPLSELFREAGFERRRRLFRMSRTQGLDAPQKYDPEVCFATDAEAEQVHGLLMEHFDPYSEQLPPLQEIRAMTVCKQVLVIRDGERVAGFVVFEINGMTSYLRYWFAHPDFRGRRVGARLLRRFFEESRATKRQLFWVVDTNRNAIEKYRHYGFCEEAMTDDVWVRNIENK